MCEIPRSDGMLKIHLSPGRISISASVQPPITPAGEKVAGLPRSTDESCDESNTVRLGGWISENYVFKSFRIDLTLNLPESLRMGR